MFADPVTATIAGASKSLNRISIKDQSSVYRTSDGSATLRISHQNTKTRTRRLIRFDDTSIAYTNNLTGDSQKPGTAVYLVVDEPLESMYTDTNNGAACILAELCAFLTANSSAMTLKFLGSEI